METYIIDKDSFSVSQVITGFNNGKIPLCPVCKSPMHVAATPEEAKKLGIPPGIQCSKVPKHFQVEFNFRAKKL